MKQVVRHVGDACRSAYQELRAPLRVCVHLRVQLSQRLVYAVQLGLQAFILLVILVKLSLVVQTLLLVQDGGKPAVDGTSVNLGFWLANRPPSRVLARAPFTGARSVFPCVCSETGKTWRVVLCRHSHAEVLLVQVIPRLRPRVVVPGPGLHGGHRTADFRVSADTSS